VSRLRPAGARNRRLKRKLLPESNDEASTLARERLTECGAMEMFYEG
jgi:hypothetical protein